MILKTYHTNGDFINDDPTNLTYADVTLHRSRLKRNGTLQDFLNALKLTE